MGDWLHRLYEISPFLGVLISGWLGGVHCLGMCGGIVGMLSLRSPTATDTSASQLTTLLGYNLGRISSYTLVGALAGGLGALLITTLGEHTAQIISTTMQYVSAFLMIALGLYIARLWQGVAYLERIGNSLLWKRIEPLGRRLRPARSFSEALLFGLVWGWLPCGLVYTFVFMALASHSALQGALLMLFFGLGTLPNLLLMGFFSANLLSWVRRPGIARIAGLSILLIGVWMLLQI